MDTTPQRFKSNIYTNLCRGRDSKFHMKVRKIAAYSYIKQNGYLYLSKFARA